MRERHQLYIHEITIPNSIYPVQAGLNSNLYLRLTDFSNTTDVTIELLSDVECFLCRCYIGIKPSNKDERSNKWVSSQQRLF